MPDEQLSAAEKALRAGFLKETYRDRKYRKAAEFLVVLGRDEAAKVMQHLSEDEVAGISGEIARIEKIDEQQAIKILEEFGYLVKTKDLVARGGVEAARKILVGAFGEEKGMEVLGRIKARTVPHPFSVLMDLDFEQLMLLVKNESPPVLAMILPHLDPQLASRVVTQLDRELQVEVARRIANLDKIDPEVLRRAEETLRERIRQQGNIVTQEIDGKAALAEILSRMDTTREDTLLDELEQEDSGLAAEIRKQLFTLDVVLDIYDVELQAVLREYGEQELVLILKGASEEVRNKILANVSARRRTMIADELDVIGPVLRTEVEKAIQEFLDYLRSEAADGNVTFRRGDDEIIV